MARYNHIHNSFIAGEVTPKFYGRTDTGQYNQALGPSKNMLLYPQGGAGLRPGTLFVKDVRHPDNSTPGWARLIPFHASDGTRWQLCLTSENPGDDASGYPWFAINTDNQAVEGIKESGPNGYYGGDYYTFQTGNGFGGTVKTNELQYAQSGDTLVITSGNFWPIVIRYDSTGTPKFKMYAWYDTPTTVFYKALPFLTPVQSAGAGSTLKLTLSSGTGTIKPGSGSTITFDASFKGRFFKFSQGGSTVMVYCYQYFSSTQLNVNVVAGSPSTLAATDFGNAAGTSYEECAWDHKKGFPRAVTFHSQRIVFGGSTGYPDTTWFSQTNNVFRLDALGFQQDAGYGTVVATDPFSATLKSEVINEIRWLVGRKTITAGTNFGEFTIYGPDSSKSIGPTNYDSNQETPHGSAKIQAIKLDNTTIFAQRGRTQLRELVYNLDEASFQATNLSLLSEHISRKSAGEYDTNATYLNLVAAGGGIEALAYQQTPHGIVWCLDANGTLVALTRERQQQVAAWHYHKIAGDSYLTDFSGFPTLVNNPFSPRVLSISCSAQKEQGDNSQEEDELWIAVMRPVPETSGSDTVGMQRIFIERLMPEWTGKSIERNWATFVPSTAPQRAPVYMDCAYIYNRQRGVIDGRPAGEIGPLPHGQGVQVDVVIDGRYVGKFTVASGKINITSALHAGNLTTWQAIVGFMYEGELRPILPEVPTSSGSSMGQLRRVDQVGIHFYRSIGAKVGRATSDEEANTPVDGFEEIQFKAGATVNDPTPLYTGLKTINFQQSYERRPELSIKTTQPLPVIITHVVSRMVVNE